MLHFSINCCYVFERKSVKFKCFPCCLLFSRPNPQRIGPMEEKGEKESMKKGAHNFLFPIFFPRANLSFSKLYFFSQILFSCKQRLNFWVMATFICCLRAKLPKLPGMIASIGLFDIFFNICIHRGNAAVVGIYHLLESLRHSAPLCLTHPIQPPSISSPNPHSKTTQIKKSLLWISVFEGESQYYIFDLRS